MTPNSDWVLVTDGSTSPGNHAALAAVRALAAGGYQAAVTVSGGPSLAAQSRFCRRRVLVPPVTDEAYGSAVLDELGSRPYVACLPASDSALLALEPSSARFLDKSKLAEEAARAGLPTPPTQIFAGFQELLAAADELPYPIVVKPTTHRFSPYRADSPSALAAVPADDGALLVQPWLDQPLRAVAGLAWDGKLVAAVHQRWLRIWKLDCGNACAATTVEPDHELEERIATLMSSHNGIFNVQFAGPFLIDVHPRVYGTHALAMAAGVNLVSLYSDLVAGKQVDRVQARPGVLFRSVEADFRHVHRSLRDGRMTRLSALGAVLPRRGTAHAIESMRDPGPALAHIWHRVRRKCGRSSY